MDGDEAESDSEWMSAADAASFAPLPYRYGLWLCRSVQLAWLLTDESTMLDAQAARLGEWLKDAFEAALNLPAREPKARGDHKPGRRPR